MGFPWEKLTLVFTTGLNKGQRRQRGRGDRGGNVLPPLRFLRSLRRERARSRSLATRQRGYLHQGSKRGVAPPCFL
ncbi:MAG: hypothetical protein F6J93_22965 [Oscillatoria sp. SIO1A7]|nr:hypothetical protein [Oscillatoria sp. SIO1A7]